MRTATIKNTFDNIILFLDLLTKDKIKIMTDDAIILNYKIINGCFLRLNEIKDYLKSIADKSKQFTPSQQNANRKNINLIDSKLNKLIKAYKIYHDDDTIPTPTIRENIRCNYILPLCIESIEIAKSAVDEITIIFLGEIKNRNIRNLLPEETELDKQIKEWVNRYYRISKKIDKMITDDFYEPPPMTSLIAAEQESSESSSKRNETEKGDIFSSFEDETEIEDEIIYDIENIYGEPEYVF